MFVVTTALIRIMEALFVIGILGSAVVILLSGVEDVHSIFVEEDHAETVQPPTA